MLCSESTAQQLNFPVHLQDWKSFTALKQTVVQASSALPWGNTHLPIKTTLDSCSQTTSTLSELPGFLHRNWTAGRGIVYQPQVKKWSPIPSGLSWPPAFGPCCPLLSCSPRTGGMGKQWHLHMGTRLPTSSHVCPAKPASSTEAGGLYSPQSFLTLHIWQNIAFFGKKALSMSFPSNCILCKFT